MLKHLINNNVKNIEISGIRKFFNLVSGEKDVVSLTIGQPDFHTPDNVKKQEYRLLKITLQHIHQIKGFWNCGKQYIPIIRQTMN